MRNLLRNTILAAVMAFGITGAMADPAEPGTYTGTVWADDSDFYKELVYPGTVTITLEGDCPDGFDDIDLRVSDNGGGYYKSVSNGCWEQIVLDVWETTNLTIEVENADKPHDTDYSLSIY